MWNPVEMSCDLKIRRCLKLVYRIAVRGEQHRQNRWGNFFGDEVSGWSSFDNYHLLCLTVSSTTRISWTRISYSRFKADTFSREQRHRPDLNGKENEARKFQTKKWFMVFIFSVNNRLVSFPIELPSKIIKLLTILIINNALIHNLVFVCCMIKLLREQNLSKPAKQKLKMKEKTKRFMTFIPVVIIRFSREEKRERDRGW